MNFNLPLVSVRLEGATSAAIFARCAQTAVDHLTIGAGDSNWTRAGELIRISRHEASAAVDASRLRLTKIDHCLTQLSCVARTTCANKIVCLILSGLVDAGGVAHAWRVEAGIDELRTVLACVSSGT